MTCERIRDGFICRPSFEEFTLSTGRVVLVDRRGTGGPAFCRLDFTPYQRVPEWWWMELEQHFKKRNGGDRP